ncbi:DUF6447 family protein (plasmid) [Sulfitobacter sp. OXR-159]|uniref:DUF6447 family protein n=1 Tax=Sulfitobacter sp. OXR-159 TaxID=3100174 RepID=UPI002AC98DB5|nr:DUF6447 family protein [Sulfitobacter sp. OXR-159]WPZ31651.1 DUF6447 family protein [Sulfitobacter sp. OXR-159]
MTEATLTGKTITIDGVAHELSNLSENARAQVTNLRVTDAEIERIKAQMAIYQTARMTYAKALKNELGKAEAH